MTLRVLIVDDEPAARRGLRRMIGREADLVVAGESGDGEAAVSAIRELRPDLVLLDIQMPGLDGFEVIEAVGAASMPPVIFVTAFDEHALRAFDVHAIDYVLKPVDPERLHAALLRARNRLSQGGGEALLSLLRELGRPGGTEFARRLVIKSTRGSLLVDMNDVEGFRAARNYVEVETAGKTHLLRETLSELEARLDPKRFVRVSRSSIVRIDRIRAILPAFNGDAVLVLANGARVAASRRYRDRLDRVLM